MANYHMASARNPDTPLDPEKLIFSNDLVHFVISTRWPEYASIPRNINGCESYRESVYNAFTGDIKDAVKFLTDKLGDAVKKRFEEYVQNNNEVTKTSFESFAAEYEKEYFLQEGDYNLRALLKYFVTLGLLAGHYYSHNITDAAEMATNFIMLKIPREQFMNSEYWDQLNKISGEILGNNNEEPTPEPVNLNLIEYQEH